MGAGKTSVAKQLSQLIGFPFYDTDLEIEKKTGVSVSWIFQVETEAGFRKRETEMIDTLTQEKGIILSTGGGSIVSSENRQFLKERGFIAYLTVSFDLQFERTKRHRGHRPLIDYPDADNRLKKLNEERQSLYEEIADKNYCTDEQNPRNIAYKIYQDFLVIAKA